MKKLFLIPLIALIFGACSSKEELVVNNIPAKKTYVKADNPNEPEYKGNDNSVYDDGPHHHGYRWWGYY